MSVRIRYNWDFIRSLSTNPEVAAVVMRAARDMDGALQAEGVETRLDSQNGPNRFRAAVIAGYEDGATAENTRRALLRALDAAGGADG